MGRRGTGTPAAVLPLVTPDISATGADAGGGAAAAAELLDVAASGGTCCFWRNAAGGCGGVLGAGRWVSGAGPDGEDAPPKSGPAEVLPLGGVRGAPVPVAEVMLIRGPTRGRRATSRCAGVIFANASCRRCQTSRSSSVRRSCHLSCRKMSHRDACCIVQHARPKAGLP